MSKARDLAGIFNLNPTSGTTAQRPATADVGEIYYNGTTGKTQIYTPTGWQDMASGIPYGNNAGRPAGVTGQPYFNGEEKRLELYTSAGWQNIVSETPGVVSISGNYLESNATNTINITGTNFTTGAIASVIGTNGVEVNANSTTVNSIVSIDAVFSGLSNANEPYDVKVTNTSNLFGLLPDALYFNASPVWQTASGSLGTFNEQVSITLSALSATDSDSTVTYALASGSSLPSGVTLNSTTGVISGTLPNIATNTTYSFTINASDGLNVIPRTFSITSQALSTLSGGSSASDSTYYYRAFTTNGSLVVSDVSVTADVLVIAGGGGGGSGWYAGGGGAGGVKLYSSLSLSPASYPVVVGNGGAGSTNTNAAGSNGQNSSFNTTNTAIGGGGGSSRQQSEGGQRYAGNGGSGGGASYPGTLGGIGTAGQGFDGGGGDGNYGASGGGAGGVGLSAVPSTHGNTGGPGTNSYSSWLSGIASVMTSVSGWNTATSTGYIGGGGAGGTTSSTTWYGGSGGGGRSSSGGSVSAENAITNTGGGGGGGSGGEQANPATGPLRGANGGSGLVIVRYLKSAAVG